MKTLKLFFLTVTKTQGKKKQELLFLSSLNLPSHGNETDAILAFASLFF